MKKTIIILATCSLLSLITDNALAEELLKYYETGKKSFDQENYELSLTNFEKALSQGDESPNLYYNLGSIHYKLGNYKTSRKYFLMLTKKYKYSALAYYNLGLIAHKQNNDNSAINFFRKSRNITRSNKLKLLNSKQIRTLTEKSRKSWYSYASAGYGYDSNVTSAPVGVATNQSGTFLRATALTNFLMTGSMADGIIAKANINATNYFETSFNDDSSLTMDLSFRDKINKWRNSYDAGIKQSTYGKDDFQRTYRFTFKARNKLVSNNELRFRYRYEDINSLNPIFDYLDGSRQKFRAEYHIKWPAEKLRLQYELEFNDRQNTNNPQFPPARNFSPTRNKITVKYDKKLSAGNSIGGEIEYRDSIYDPTATQNRSDQRVGAIIKHAYRFNQNWNLRTRIKYRNNDSNEPGNLFDYKRSIATIDLSCIF